MEIGFEYWNSWCHSKPTISSNGYFYCDQSELLSCYRADPNKFSLYLQEGKGGRTILHYAVERVNGKLLRFLLDECPIGPNGLRIDMPNYAGHTAYQLARVNDPSMADELVSRGADDSSEDIDEEDHPDHNVDTDEDDEVGT